LAQHKLSTIIEELEKIRMPESSGETEGGPTAKNGYFTGIKRMFGY